MAKYGWFNMPKKFTIYLNKNEYLKSKNLTRMLLLDIKLDGLPKIVKKKVLIIKKLFFPILNLAVFEFFLF